MMKINKNECNYVDLARALSIFFVLLAHFRYDESMAFEKFLVYTFSLPVFFFVSGMLHRQQTFGMKALKVLFIGLVIPYFMYNIVFYIGESAIGIHVVPLKDLPLSLLLHDKGILPSGATWFLLSLLTMKLVSIFLKSVMAYIIVSILCIVYLVLFIDTSEVFENGIIGNYSNMLKYKSTILMFPFFAGGYLMRNFSKININNIKPYYKIAFIVATCVIVVYVASITKPTIAHFPEGFVFGDSLVLNVLDPVFPWYSNLATAYLVTGLSTIAVIFFSQLTIEYVKSDFIKVLSRGTMLIVATHIIFVLGNNFLMEHGVGFGGYLFIASLEMVLFYFCIKYTYDRFPLLYGRPTKAMAKAFGIA